MTIRDDAFISPSSIPIYEPLDTRRFSREVQTKKDKILSDNFTNLQFNDKIPSPQQYTL